MASCSIILYYRYNRFCFCITDTSEQPVLETLRLLPVDSGGESFDGESAGEFLSTCDCVLCNETFDLSTGNDDLLRHLLLSHKLVIAEVHLIADLKR